MNTTADRLVTDALLLDAADGLDAVASRLADLYRGGRRRNSAALLEDLSRILSDLGWWSGRLLGAVSDETAAVVDRLASEDD